MRTTTPRLLPGLLVLRRSRQQWQVGLRHPHTLPDSPEVAQVVDEATGQIASGGGRTLLADLEHRGVLLDPSAATVLRPPYGTDAQRRTARDVAAAVLRHGPLVEQALHRRRGTVLVRCHGPAADDVADEVDRLLHGVGGGGLRRPPRRGGPGRPDAYEDGDGPAGRPADGTPVLVVSDGEPPRELLDDLLRHRTPHLLLRLVEGAVLLGPFVQPGVTACLRCDDLHRAEADPAWPLLVAQAARQGGLPRPDGVATPADALAVAAAAATAARDLVRALEGSVPGSWSAELRWGGEAAAHVPGPDAGPAPTQVPGELVRRRIARHAACACGCWEVPAAGVA